MPRTSRSTLFPYTTLFRSRLQQIFEIRFPFERREIVNLFTGADETRGNLECILDRKSTRLNSSHPSISYAVFCLKKKKAEADPTPVAKTPRHPTLGHSPPT